MLRRSLAAEYLCLAKGFAEEGVPKEALGCVTAAVQLDDSNHGDELRQLLASLAGQDFEHQAVCSSKLARLRRRRQKLDATIAREEEISQSVGTFPQPPPSSPEGPVPSEMLRRIAALESRLAALVGWKFENARRGMKDLLNRITPDFTNGGTRTSQACSPDEGTDEFHGSLSVEHELHSLANDFYHIQRYDEAISCYNVVLGIDDELLETWFNRGLAYTRNRQYEKAEEDLSKAIELNPHLPELWYTRGLIREYKEEFEKAIADYEKTLEIDRGYQKAREQHEIARGKLDESHSRGRERRSDSSDSEGRIKDFSAHLSKPDSCLDDVGGHHEVKRRLRCIAAYLKGDPVLVEWGAELPRGVLLCGRPGVGKTHLARCLAGEAQCPFYAPPTSVFEDMWAGNMQKNLRKLWEQAASHQKAIIFLDEFDSLGSCRTGARDPDSWYNRMVGCILELMDNLARRSERIVVIAATNRRQNIDQAFLRPGRFSYVIDVEAPTASELAEIWLIHLEAASSRATRIDFVTPELNAAILASRQDWLDTALASRSGDSSGIIRLAHLAAEKDLVGDDVREVIRRTIDERVMAALDCGVDLGSIGPDDLYRQLDDYEPIRADYEEGIEEG